MSFSIGTHSQEVFVSSLQRSIRAVGKEVQCANGIPWPWYGLCECGGGLWGYRRGVRTDKNPRLSPMLPRGSIGDKFVDFRVFSM